jgi:7,8-dihydropterin-6-yl-methyl-4-(beta-D-ribofuranosyl)aminobenzene 5'-phosphate synthase
MPRIACLPEPIEHSSIGFVAGLLAASIGHPSPAGELAQETCVHRHELCRLLPKRTPPTGSRGRRTILASRTTSPAVFTGEEHWTTSEGEGDMSRFRQDKRKAEEAWTCYTPPPLDDIGSVERLEILPLIDWYTENETLVGEAGVAYVIRADDKTILFDTGANWKNEDPSPLLRNMRALGVPMDQVDAVVISHPHPDHTGGLHARQRNMFALSPTDVDLSGRKAFVPSPLTHQTAEVILSERPTVIYPGIATTGVILRALWRFGLTPEQALAVHVRGKGIVLIVGCGHMGLGRLIQRYRQLFDEPLYALFGGLHFPVTASRTRRPSQKWAGTGKLPWQRITRREVNAAVAELAAAHPHLVGISSHDSCDWSVGRFREAFGDHYRAIVVGRGITVD